MRHTPQNTSLNYYPFGSAINSRAFASEGYRFGMNGQEKDDELAGTYSAEYWQYNARLGRRWNVDPVIKSHESPYATFANNPIWFVDYNGADTLVAPTGTKFEAGDGYLSHDNGNYLHGEGLQSKIFDPCYEGGDELKGGGGYVNYYGEIPGLGLGENVTTSLQVQTKGKEEKSGWQLPWWLESDAFTGHSDPVLSAPDASGAVYQVGGTASGFTGGVFIGMSKSDGFNLGFYAGGEFNPTRWGGGLTIQAASGDFTWENYAEFGTNVNFGHGGVSYSYSEGGIPFDGIKSNFSMHGLSFGVGTNWLKSSTKLNASTGVTYTIPLLR